MQDFSKVFELENDGFEGFIECYLVDTSKENLENWLEREVGDTGNVYSAFKKSTGDVLIIKNLFLEPEYRGKGFGVKVFEEILTESKASSAVLVCDVFETQKPGFDLGVFYKEQGFRIITENSHHCLLMVYPENIAQRVLQNMDHKSPHQFKI